MTLSVAQDTSWQVAQSEARLQNAAQTAKDQAKLKEACGQFESMFLSLMWKEMRKTVSKGSLFHGGFGEEMFTSQLDQAYADLSSKERSMGLADMLYSQMKPQSTARPGGGAVSRELSTAQTDLLMPVDDARITSTFGERVHPITGELSQHQGVDLAAAEGTPVKAAAAGRVVFAGEQDGYGNLVILEHADGRQTYYGHLAEIMVGQGDRVDSGQQVATVGSTGMSTGPHLHFEVRDAGGEATDPWPMLAGGLAGKG